jgi:conjugal transfer/entry exclusion protein
MRMRRGLSLLLIGLWLWSANAFGIFGVGDAVYDLANHFENIVQVGYQLDQVFLSIQNLASLGSLVAENQEAITQAQRLAQILIQIGSRMTGRYSRWIAIIPQGASIPCTVVGLVAWQKAYDQDTKESLADAGYVQTIITDNGVNMEAIQAAFHLAQSIAGSVQGLQSLHGPINQLAILLGRMQTMRAPHDESKVRLDMREHVISEAMDRISDARMAGLYGRPAPMCLPIPGV